MYCVLISVNGAKVFAMRVAPELRAHYLLNTPSNTRTLCPTSSTIAKTLAPCTEIKKKKSLFFRTSIRTVQKSIHSSTRSGT